MNYLVGLCSGFVVLLVMITHDRVGGELVVRGDPLVEKLSRLLIFSFVVFLHRTFFDNPRTGIVLGMYCALLWLNRRLISNIILAFRRGYFQSNWLVFLVATIYQFIMFVAGIAATIVLWSQFD